jgi:hypothetical protein
MRQDSGTTAGCITDSKRLLESDTERHITRATTGIQATRAESCTAEKKQRNSHRPAEMLGEQVVLPGVDLGAIGGDHRAVTSDSGDVQAREGVDHVSVRGLQVRHADLLVECQG